jgi:two-component system C4-dicarboxylate transport response regulator DctD
MGVILSRLDVWLAQVFPKKKGNRVIFSGIPVARNKRLHPETKAKDLSPYFVQGRSRCMERLSETMLNAGKSDTEVLLVGEAGTGKKMIARDLHDRSPRRHNNFVAIDCSSLPKKKLEKDLFGQGPGVFTGASHLRTGRLESADAGTVFLNKIDSLPLRLQDKLLYVLQEGNIKRPGSDALRSIDIRVIASTKEDLKNACGKGRFLESLYCRLNGIQIVLPSLKEHLEDIPLLFQHFIRRACAKYQSPTPLMTREIYQKLSSRKWPGNGLELKNVAERFALGIGLDLLDPINQEESVDPDRQIFDYQMTLVEKMNAFEKKLIAEELARTNGNVKTTYKALGLPRKTFYDKMNKHGLKRKDFLEPGHFPNGISFPLK